MYPIDTICNSSIFKTSVDSCYCALIFLSQGMSWKWNLLSIKWKANIAFFFSVLSFKTVLTHLSSQRIILSQRVVKSFDLLFSTWQNITSLFEVFNVVLSIFMNCRCNSFSAMWRKTCYRCLRYVLKTVAEGLCDVRGKKPPWMI